MLDGKHFSMSFATESSLHRARIIRASGGYGVFGEGLLDPAVHFGGTRYKTVVCEFFVSGPPNQLANGWSASEHGSGQQRAEAGSNGPCRARTRGVITPLFRAARNGLR